MGVKACEALFLADKIVLVEGQEDVVIYERMLRKLNIDLPGNFFGWGTGGADKMHDFCKMLKELGYYKVFGILDNNKSDVRYNLAAEYPNYSFACIPCDDVRDKRDPKDKSKISKKGLCDTKGNVHKEHEDDVRKLFGEVNAYFAS